MIRSPFPDRYAFHSGWKFIVVRVSAVNAANAGCRYDLDFQAARTRLKTYSPSRLIHEFVPCSSALRGGVGGDDLAVPGRRGSGFGIEGRRPAGCTIGLLDAPAGAANPAQIATMPRKVARRPREEEVTRSSETRAGYWFSRLPTVLSPSRRMQGDN